MGTVYNTNVVTDGLIFCIDMANRRCVNSLNGDAMADGTVVSDLVGGNNATSQNGTILLSAYSKAPVSTFAAGKNSPWSPGKGWVDFDGTDDSLDFDGYVPENVNTVSFWIMISDSTSDFVLGQSAAVFDASQWDWGFHKSGSILYAYLNSGSITLTGSNVYEYGQWFHVTLVRDNGSNSLLYIDGELVTSGSSDTVGSETKPLRVAGGLASHIGRYNLGDLRLYNRALTAEEIKQNLNATKAHHIVDRPIGLILSYDIGDSDCYNGGTTITDLTGNGNNGTLNGPTFSSDTTGGSLLFDGVDDYIALPATNSIIGDSAEFLSMLCWFKSDGGTGIEYLSSLKRSASASDILYGLTLNSNDGSAGAGYLGHEWYGSSAVRYGNSSLSANNGDWHFICSTMNKYNCTTILSNQSDYYGHFTWEGGQKNFNRSYSLAQATGNTAITEIGAHNGSNFFGGNIGMFRIYNTPVAWSEAVQIYQATKGRFGH